MQINLEDIRALLGEGENGVIGELAAVVQFKLGKN